MAAALAASLALAACGGGSSDSSTTTTTAAPARSSTTVGVKSVDGIGTVLVDATGQALYAADQEAGGKIVCTGGCTSDWQPLAAPAGTPTAASAVGKLSVVERPDGTRQVAVAGKPLYTFADDPPGQVTGNGFDDDFAGTHFTWHAALAGGKQAQAKTQGGSYGY